MCIVRIASQLCGTVFCCRILSYLYRTEKAFMFLSWMFYRQSRFWQDRFTVLSFSLNLTSFRLQHVYKFMSNWSVLGARYRTIKMQTNPYGSLKIINWVTWSINSPISVIMLLLYFTGTEMMVALRSDLVSFSDLWNGVEVLSWYENVRSPA